MSAATSFYAAFRPLFRQIGHWCTGIPNETPRAVKMSRLLYEQLELVCPVTTKSGKLSTSEASLVRLQGQHKAYLFSDKECCERSRDSL